MFKNRLFIVLFGCLSSAMLLAQKPLKGKVLADSVSILSPHIEVTLPSGRVNEDDNYIARDKIAKLVIDELQTLLNKDTYIDLPLMKKDFRFVNTVLEPYYTPKHEFPAPPRMPEEVLTDKSQYSLLVTIYDNYTNPDISLVVSLINNRTKYRNYYLRSGLRDSGDPKYIRNTLKGILNKIIVIPTVKP